MTSEPSAADYQWIRDVQATLGAGEKSEPVTLMQHLREVDPGPHLDWWHVGAMAEACQGVLDGDIERLAIQAPPRSFKSRVVVQGGSSCRVRNEPRSKVFVSCADDGLVKYHSRHARAMALHEASGVRLKADSRAVELWETAANGTFKASTIRAAVLGFGWDLGVVDDPFRSRAEAQRSLAQTTTWEWYRDDFLSRKQARPEGGPPGQIILQQSLSIGDLIRRLLKWLGAEGLEDWHLLTLKGYAERSSVVLPGCVTEIPDPRRVGEPLCNDDGLMAPIAERKHSNPALHRCVDQQDPVEDAGGGVFCRSWFRIVGRSGPPDVERPVAGLVRIGRGWDFNAGGADKTASAKGGPTESDRWRWEHAREYDPPAALLAQLVIDTALDDGPGVEQVLPNEPAVGKAFSERLALDLRKLGFTVHLAGQREPKRSRSLQHAGKAAARCGRCRQLIVPAEAVEMFKAQGVCKCPEPDGDGYGAVDFLEGDWNEPAGDRLHAFTGEPGGADDLPDAMAVLFNALATALPRDWYIGGVPGAEDEQPQALGNRIEDL